MEKNTAVRTKAKVIIDSSHAPIKPIIKNEISVPIANFLVANCNAINTKNRITTYGFKKSKKLSIAFKTISIGTFATKNTSLKFVTIESIALFVQSSKGINASLKGSKILNSTGSSTGAFAASFVQFTEDSFWSYAVEAFPHGSLLIINSFIKYF